MEEVKFNIHYTELKKSERSIYSQGGQDGVLVLIFNKIGHGRKLCVEFGARDGVELSNTANLRLRYGWIAILIDAEPKSEIVFNHLIMPDNINEIFKYHYVLNRIDYLSIDVDGNDYWIWQALEDKPRVVSIEYNSKFRNDESYAIKYNPDHKWEGDDYYGASLLAFKKLGERKGYTLVYVVDRYDAVFVRNDLISPDYVPPTLDELLPEPIIAHEKQNNKKWVTV